MQHGNLASSLCGETKGFITKIMVKREADEANSETNMTHIINYKN